MSSPPEGSPYPPASDPGFSLTGEISLPGEAIAEPGAIPPPAPAPPGGFSIKKALMTSAAWTMAGWAVMQGLRFASNLYLTRLLFPEAFGLMTLVTTFIVGLNMFSDVGIGPSIVQNKRGEDPDFYNTAWTVQVVRGLGLWLVMVLIAWPFALFYDQEGLPSLAYMLPVVGLATAINAFDSTAVHTLDRRLLQGRRVVLQVVCFVVSIAVTVYLAYLYRSVWALVVGNLVSAVLTTVGSHVVLPDVRNRLRWDRESLRELTHFGRWIFFGTICTFFANHTDRLVLGKFSVALLGVYGIAVSLVMVPTALLGRIASQLVFPYYSRALEQGKTPSEALVRGHPLCAGFAAFTVCGLIAAGPTLVRIAYPFPYHAAGWMIQILALGAWFQALDALAGGMLWALGWSRVPALGNLGKVLALPVLMPLGYWLGGMPGLIIGFVVAELVRYVVSVGVLRREGIPILRYDLSLTVLIALIAVAAVLPGPWLWPERPQPGFLASLAFAPHAGFPGAVPWAGLIHGFDKDFGRLVPRFFTEVGIVVVLWALVLLVAWRLGLVKR